MRRECEINFIRSSRECTKIGEKNSFERERALRLYYCFLCSTKLSSSNSLVIVLKKKLYLRFILTWANIYRSLPSSLECGHLHRSRWRIGFSWTNMVVVIIIIAIVLDYLWAFRIWTVVLCTFCYSQLKHYLLSDGKKLKLMPKTNVGEEKRYVYLLIQCEMLCSRSPLVLS